MESDVISAFDQIDVLNKSANIYMCARSMGFVPYGMTTRKGVFAGGDVTNRPASVVHAMHDAKLVAEGIMKYVDAIKLMEHINRR